MIKKINITKKGKIVVISPILAHYRRDLYNHLLSSDDFEFTFVGGEKYLNIQSIKNFDCKTFNYFSFSFFNHKFYYLKGALKYILTLKPKIVISSGVDFHLIHTLVLFVIYRIILRNKFYWWSQGTEGHQGKFGWFMRKLAYKFSSGALLYNQSGKDNLLKMGIKSQNLMVVGNSLNKDDYGYLNHNIYKKKSVDKFTILYSGRVTKAKKLNILIKALSILKEKNAFDFRCYIIGDGDIHSLIDLAKELNISEKIEFVGAKYGKDVYPYFLDSNLFVYPGGIGLSILHALSFGLPVITSNDYSLHFPEFELLYPMINGDLYQEGSSIDLANKIIEWHEKIFMSMNDIKKNCIDSIEKLGYLPEKVSSAILELISNHKD